jgi:hypothetical protein
MMPPLGRPAVLCLALLTAAVVLLPKPAVAMPGRFAHPDSGATMKGNPPLPKNMAPLPKAPAQSADLAHARKVAHVDLVIRHRVFTDFVDQVKAVPAKPFGVGDTDYSATVIQYVPDFAMDIESGRIYSRTDQPNNPAFKIAVRQKDAPVDTTWALLDMPPHFARKSMLSFQVMRIEYTSGKPLLARVQAPPPATAAKTLPAAKAPPVAAAPGGKGK